MLVFGQAIPVMPHFKVKVWPPRYKSFHIQTLHIGVVALLYVFQFGNFRHTRILIKL